MKKRSVVILCAICDYSMGLFVLYRAFNAIMETDFVNVFVACAMLLLYGIISKAFDT